MTSRILSWIKLRYKTFSPPRGSLRLPLCGHIHFFLAPTPSLTSTNQFFIYNCVSLRMLDKWNQTVYNLLGIGFLLLGYSGNASTLLHGSSFLLLSGIPWLDVL